jgi:hypothetical protein
MDQKYGFGSDHGSQIQTQKDLFRDVDHESTQFQKIQPVLTFPMNPYKFSQFFSTIVQKESLKI